MVECVPISQPAQVPPLELPKKSYGTIVHNAKAKQWDITCEAHVALRLKRTFGKANERQHKTLSIAATRENSRDLEWFIERYPMEVTPLDLLTQLSEEHVEAETVVAKILAGMTAPVTFELKLPARDYQTVAALFWETVKGYLLGDAPGLGKTVSSICGLMIPGTLPALVVTLTHLPEQWKREIERFSDIEVHILKTGKPYDITKYHNGRFPDVIISNYHKLSGWASTLNGLLKSVVFDEVHELRHTGSAKYAAAKAIADSVIYKLGMSATPIFGYGGEIFNILEVLRPGALGSEDEFHREWGSDKIKDPAAFGMYLREAGLLLRRTRKDVGRECPPVTVIPHTIDADVGVLEEMKGQAIELAKMVLRRGEDFKGQKMRVAGDFDMKMRQATGIAKAPFVAEFVKMLHVNTGEKIVVFAWHREVYAILMELLAELKPVLYTGSENPKQKQASLDSFITGDSQVMLISLRAGAGMDGLQYVCRLGVVAELDYAPATHIQNTGRIDRDGQEGLVLMYYLLSDHGSDPVLSDILGVKRQQLDGINSPLPDMVEELQIEVGHVKRLAREFLIKQGIELPEEDTPKEITP